MGQTTSLSTPEEVKYRHLEDLRKEADSYKHDIKENTELLTHLKKEVDRMEFNLLEDKELVRVMKKELPYLRKKDEELKIELDELIASLKMNKTVIQKTEDQIVSLKIVYQMRYLKNELVVNK